MDNSRYMPMVNAFMSGPNAQPGSEFRTSHPRFDQFLTAHPNFNVSQMGQIGQGGLFGGMWGNRPHAMRQPGGPLGGIAGIMSHLPAGLGINANPAPRPQPSPGGYNTGIVPPGMGQPAPPPMQHMGPGSGMAPPMGAPMPGTMPTSIPGRVPGGRTLPSNVTAPRPMDAPISLAPGRPPLPSF